MENSHLPSRSFARAAQLLEDYRAQYNALDSEEQARLRALADKLKRARTRYRSMSDQERESFRDRFQSLDPDTKQQFAEDHQRLLNVLRALVQRQGNFGWSKQLEQRARRDVARIDHTTVIDPGAVDQLPTSFNWEDQAPGLLRRRVKNQAGCGCCYAFATTNALGMRYFILSGGAVDVDLSPQFLMDCGPASCVPGLRVEDGSTWPCQGGSFAASFCSIAQNGVPEEECYPYRCESGVSVCPSSRGCAAANADPHMVDCTKYYCTEPVSLNLSGSSAQQRIDNIKLEIFQNGPVVAGFQATNAFMNHRGSSVFSNPRGWDEPGGGHAVVLYGWGREGDQEYWLVLNSWSRTWGDNGTARVNVRGTDIGRQDVYGSLPLLDDSLVDPIRPDTDVVTPPTPDPAPTRRRKCCLPNGGTCCIGTERDEGEDVDDERAEPPPPPPRTVDRCERLGRLRDRLQPGKDLTKAFAKYTQAHTRRRPCRMPRMFFLLLALVVVIMIAVAAYCFFQ